MTRFLIIYTMIFLLGLALGYAVKRSYYDVPVGQLTEAEMEEGP